MQKEIEAHRDTHTDEQEEKEKKILEMGNQLALVEKQHEDRISRLQRDLEDSREQVLTLKRDVAKIPFYEKKVEQMSDLKNDLTDA